MECKKYIVYWVKNVRIGSIELTNENIKESKKKFNMNLIQKDITGTEHYEVISIK